MRFVEKWSTFSRFPIDFSKFSNFQRVLYEHKDPYGKYQVPILSIIGCHCE